MILFVVNEKAGNGRGKRVWKSVKKQLLSRGTEYAVISALCVEDAIREAETRLSAGGVKALVAVGGDGTVHGLLPLAEKCNVPLGLIPAGSGNDTALAFGVPKDPAAALDTILRGHTRAADLLATELPDGSRGWSLISVAIGLDGAVAEDVNESRYKRWCNAVGAGPLAYVIGLFRMLAVYKPRTLTVTIDGETREFRDAWLAAVANLATYGGGLKICPDASPDDGLLHVCVVHGCTAWQLLRVFPSVLSGAHVRSRFVTLMKGKEVSVDSSAPLPAYGDGEPAASTPIRAAVRPSRLLFLTSVSG